MVSPRIPVNVQPDASAFRAFLTRAARRLAWVAAAQGAAAGLAIALVLSVAGWPTPGAYTKAAVAALSLAVAGVVVRWFIFRARGERVALLVERRAPQCRNLLITADELASTPAVVHHIATLVYSQAARLVTGLDVGALFPLKNAIIALAVTSVLWSIAVARIATSHGSSVAARASSRSASAAINAIDVTITPPVYSGKTVQYVHDPARIDALVGSRIRLTVHARAAGVSMESIRARDTLVASGAETFDGELIADADGYIAVEPHSDDGHAGVRRLIGVTVIPDAAPRVRVTAPARDLFLRDAHQTIDVGIDASDDLRLASLKLRYTKVSGSGERFTFTEGEVPLDVVRIDGRAWKAHATWRLDPLGLSPGDMVVYRAVAADFRPGATPAESDSYIAEILLPGGDAAAGFALDPEQERYAVSQQMVILKTERLSARHASMSADAFSTAAQELAAEQRKVRAEFVFMMGGELADAPDLSESLTDINEEAEAEGESDLLAGRMANQGRVALLRAIRSMSRAAASLTTADLTPALSHERAALAQLERAFSRTRIILRALTERERLDLTRRLTGVLTDAARDVHPSVNAEPNARVLGLRRVLAGIATLAGAAQFTADAPAQTAALAEEVLRVDASEKTLQSVATLLNDAGDAIAKGHTSDARDLLDRAATGIATALRGDLLDAPIALPPSGVNRLNGALNDALRRPRGAP
ncbi:MAG TPA: hypothetical protein VK636_02825 [Gemmatimonadaceae bacterium]|nr:hypothetical protein [Gemmatimonadaceae bacterium]